MRKILIFLNLLFLPLSFLVAITPKELPEIRKKASEGDLDSQIELAMHYESIDKKECLKWTQKTAEQGFVHGQILFAQSYLEKGNIAEAYKWLRKAADQNDALAQAFVGGCYATGEIVKKDFKEAVRWYEKSAEQGNAEGQYRLGLCYQKGDGVNRDVRKAVKLFESAAKQDLVKAQVSLAYIFLKQPFPDYNKSFLWCKKAADNNEPEALMQLGNMYVKGQGVSPNLNNAKEYFERAYQNGHPEAKATLYVYSDKNYTTSKGLDRTFTISAKGCDVNVHCDQDVISFMTNFSPSLIEEFKSVGYNGFNSISINQLADLLEEQNYVEILKHLRTEKDLNKTISFLKDIVSESHPVLILELSRMLCLEINAHKIDSKQKVLEAFKWWSIGSTLIEIDTACNTDKSTYAALKVSDYYYPQEILDKRYLNLITTTEITNYIYTDLKNWELKNTLPSPKWVIFHGMGAMSGENTLKPSSEWPSLREKKFTEIKESFLKMKKKLL